MTKLIINQVFLQQGIRHWRTNSNWDQDFHNNFYSRMFGKDYLKPANWPLLVNELISWKAHRPLSREQLIQNGYLKIGKIRTKIDALRSFDDFTLMDFTQVEWAKVEEIFELSNSIKGFDSPMFGSKLCHFLLPNLFPVYDSQIETVTGTSSYPFYWGLCRNGWIECKEKETLKIQLSNEIGGSVIPTYPWATKIAELCCLGGGVIR